MHVGDASLNISTPGKRGPTSSNIVGCNMLASFEHYVG